jgi:hypothetical protein
MLGGRDPDAQALQPRLLPLVVGEVDLEGQVVYRRPLRVQSPVASLPRAVEERQDLRMPAEPVCDAEEGGMVEPPEEFQAEDLPVEPLHGVQVGDPKGDLAQPLDPPRRLAHRDDSV